MKPGLDSIGRPENIRYAVAWYIKCIFMPLEVNPVNCTG